MAVGRHTVRVNDAWIASAVNGDPEDQIQPASQIYIRVDCDAGTDVWNDGVAYRLHVILLDIVNNYMNMFDNVTSGHLNNAADVNEKWRTQHQIFTFGPIAAPAQDHLLQIETVLTTGVAGQGVNVYQGEITPVAA